MSWVENDALKDKLDALFRLQDLDIMIRELKDPPTKGTEEKMGFSVAHLEKLQLARTRLAERIPALDLRLYERISRHFTHAIVSVENRICLGCFMGLPTSAVSLRTEPGMVRLCENCGRILYWLDY
jgi:predicted  nucleic acid-binding Zn-ribbon protein